MGVRISCCAPVASCFPSASSSNSKACRRTATWRKPSSEALAQIEAKQYAARLLEAGVPAEQIRKLAVVVSGRRVKVRAG